MLFVLLMTWKPHLSRQQLDEAAQRRARWQDPAGTRTIGEYWVQGTPAIIAIVDAAHPATLLPFQFQWSDVFDIETHPALTAQEGLRVLQQLGYIRRRGRRPKAVTLFTEAIAQAEAKAPRRRGRRPRVTPTPSPPPAAQSPAAGP
ncbi:MAG: hypothetical protein HY686_00440 [Chloroflexi bacterium]|nr:hypothetical protein [Chloroflexota bacterium]